MSRTISLFVEALPMLGSAPNWPPGQAWEYYSGGGLGLICIILVALMFLDRP
ncbi:MAG: DUF3309 domain-containing protein [Deltaproteobacteria bacterium]|nr:DUF3309 domain-containing protein [Deltaproteobacteria bacterium]